MDIKNLEYIANLSRLRLEDSEKNIFSEQLDSIFNYISKLNNLNTDNIEPMTNGVKLSNVFREDIKASSILKKQAIENAPSKTPHFFKVPQVLD